MGSRGAIRQQKTTNAVCAARGAKEKREEEEDAGVQEAWNEADGVNEDTGTTGNKNGANFQCNRQVSSSASTLAA